MQPSAQAATHPNAHTTRNTEYQVTSGAQVANLKIRKIYDLLLAAAFHLPRTFQDGDRHAQIYAEVASGQRNE